MSNSPDQTHLSNTESASPTEGGFRLPRAFGMGSLAVLLVLTASWLAFAVSAAPAADRDGSHRGSRPSSQPPSVTGLERVHAYVQPSVVYIGLNWTGWVYDTYNKRYLNNGGPITLSAQCTGFVVNPAGYIATAGHCVDPDVAEADFIAAAATWAVEAGYYVDPDLTVADIIGFNTFRVEGTDSKAGPDLKIQAAWSASAAGVEIGKALPARVIAYQPFDEGDAALLKVHASGLNAIELQSESDVRVGTKVVAVGYPSSVDAVTDPDFSASYKDGSISSLKTVDDGLLPVYEISAAVSGGMSGGPAVDLQGRLIGTNSFIIEGEQQPFNFVRPTQMLGEILADAGVQNELSPTDRQYHLGLDAYFKGDRTAAIKALRTVMRQQPTHHLAQDYLARARDLPVPVPAVEDETNTPYAAVGSAVAVLALVLLAASALMHKSTTRSRPRPENTPTTGSAHVPSPAAAPNGALYGGPTSRPEGSADDHDLEGHGLPQAVTTLLAKAEDRCPSCHGDTTATQRFCGHCGIPLGPRA